MLNHNTSSVRHVLDRHGRPLCGREPSEQAPDRWSPVCGACRRTRAFWADTKEPDLRHSE